MKEEKLWNDVLKYNDGNVAVTEKFVRAIKREAEELCKKGVFPRHRILELKKCFLDRIVKHSLFTFAQLCLIDGVEVGAKRALEVFLESEGIPVPEERLLNLLKSKNFNELLGLTIRYADTSVS